MAAQKTDRFALQVKKPEDLPASLRPAYTEAQRDGSCRHSVYAPPITNLPAYHQQPITGYLLMIFDERVLFAIDRDEHQVEIIDVPLTDMICIEHGEVLLFSWMKFVFGRSTRREIKILFNSVGAELFTGALDLAPFFDPLRLRGLRLFVDRHALVPVFDSSGCCAGVLHCNGVATLR